MGRPSGPAFPKDGIADHVVHGADDGEPRAAGTKAALWYRLTVAAGESSELRLRLSPEGSGVNGGWQQAMAAREREADEFYADPYPSRHRRPTRRWCCARP